MRPGETVETMMFGPVIIDRMFESEAAARAAGYYYDAHGPIWKYPCWKILGKLAEDPRRENDASFCAARVPSSRARSPI